MSKRVFRYFLNFIDGQERWLNGMAQRGFRLKTCGKALYVFDECEPNEYEYIVEIVGELSDSKARDYQKYLEGMGFRTFTKNINLNFSFGKVRWRPYAKGMGQIASTLGSYNKELLILEKRKDGKPFDLHTNLKDKLNAYKTVRRLYIYAVFLLFGILTITFIPGVSSQFTFLSWGLRIVIGVISFSYLIPTVKYSLLVKEIKEESQLFE